MYKVSVEQEEQAVKMARDLENFVNPIHNVEAFVQHIIQRTHRTLQQQIGKLVFSLIKEWAATYNRGMYDLRNEEVCEKCKQIDDIMTREHSNNWNNLPMI